MGERVASAEESSEEQASEEQASDVSRPWKHVFSGRLLTTQPETHADDGCHDAWRLTVYLPQIKWPHYRFHWSCRARRRDAPGYEQVWYTEMSAREHIVSIFGVQRDAHTVTHRGVWLRAANMRLLTIESGYDWRGHRNVMAVHETAVHIPLREPDPHGSDDYLATARVRELLGMARSDNLRLRSWTYRRRWLTKQCAARFYVLGDAFFRSHEHLAAHMAPVDMRNVLQPVGLLPQPLTACRAYRPEAAHSDGWCTVHFDYARTPDAERQRLDWRKTRLSQVSAARVVQDLEDEMAPCTGDTRFERPLHPRRPIRTGAAAAAQDSRATAFEELELDVAVDRLLAYAENRHCRVDVTRESIQVTPLAHVRYEHTHVDDRSLRYSTVTDRQTRRRVLRFRRTDWRVAPRYQCDPNDATCADRLLGCHCVDCDVSGSGATLDASAAAALHDCVSDRDAPLQNVACDSSTSVTFVTSESRCSTSIATATPTPTETAPSAVPEPLWGQALWSRIVDIGQEHQYRCAGHDEQDDEEEVAWIVPPVDAPVAIGPVLPVVVESETAFQARESKLPLQEAPREMVGAAKPRATATGCGAADVIERHSAAAPKWDWDVAQDACEGLRARNHQHESVCVRSHTAQFRHATSKQMWLPDGTLVYDVDVADTGALDVRLSRLSELDPAYWLVAYGVHVPVQLDIFADTPRERSEHGASRAAKRMEEDRTDGDGETRRREHMAAFALHGGERYGDTATFACPWALSSDGWRVTWQCDIDVALRPHIFSARTHCLGTDAAHSNWRRDARVTEGRRPENECCDAIAASSRAPLYDAMRSNEAAGHEGAHYSCPHHDSTTVARVANWYAGSPHRNSVDIGTPEMKRDTAPTASDPHESSSSSSSSLVASFVTATRVVSCEGERPFIEARQGWRQTLSLGGGTTQTFEVCQHQYGRTFVGGSDIQPLSDRVRICTRETHVDARGQTRDVSLSVQEWERDYLPWDMHHPWRNLGLHIDRILRLTCDELDYHASTPFSATEASCSDETRLSDRTPRAYEFCSLALHESFGDLATVATHTLAGSTDLTWLPSGRQHILAYIGVCGRHLKTRRDASHPKEHVRGAQTVAPLGDSLATPVGREPRIPARATTPSATPLPTRVESNRETATRGEEAPGVVFVEPTGGATAPDQETSARVNAETCSRFPTDWSRRGRGPVMVCDTVHTYATSAAAHTILVADWTLREAGSVNLADHGDIEPAAYSAGISVRQWHKRARLGCDRACERWVSAATASLERLPCGLRSAHESLRRMATVGTFSERETRVLLRAFAILAADYSESTRGYDDDRDRRRHARYYTFTRNSLTRDTGASRVSGLNADAYARRVRNDWHLSYGTSLGVSRIGNGNGSGSGGASLSRIGWQNWARSVGCDATENVWPSATRREARAVRDAHRAVCAHLSNAQHPPQNLLRTRRVKVRLHDYGDASDRYRELMRRCALYLAPQTDVVLSQPFRVRDLQHGYLLACETLERQRHHRRRDLLEYTKPTEQPMMHAAAWSTIRRILKVGSATSRKATQTLETGVHRTTAYGRPTDDSYEIDERNRLLVGSSVNAHKRTLPVSVYKLAADSLASYPNPVVVEISLLDRSKLVSQSTDKFLTLVPRVPPVPAPPTSPPVCLAHPSLHLPSKLSSASLPTSLSSSSPPLTLSSSSSSSSHVSSSFFSAPLPTSLSLCPAQPFFSSSPHVASSLFSTSPSASLSSFPAPSTSFSSSPIPPSLSSSPQASPSPSSPPPSLSFSPGVPSRLSSSPRPPSVVLPVCLSAFSSAGVACHDNPLPTALSASSVFASQRVFSSAAMPDVPTLATKEEENEEKEGKEEKVNQTLCSDVTPVPSDRESKRPLKLDVVLSEDAACGFGDAKCRSPSDRGAGDDGKRGNVGVNEEGGRGLLGERARQSTEAEEVARNEEITRTLTDWGHTKLVLTLGQVRSIRPVCNQGGVLVYLDEYRGEPCICCYAATSAVVQLCPCRLLLCAACSSQLVRKNDGKCIVCFGAIRGMHTLDPAQESLWKGVYKEAPSDMAYADAARRYSLQTAYSFIGIRNRGELLEYRINQLVQVPDVKLRRGKCGPGISVFADAQDTLQYLPHFDVPDWARPTTTPAPPQTSSSSSSPSLSSSSSSSLHSNPSSVSHSSNAANI